MHKQRVLGLMLAATFAVAGLAGCQSPAQTAQPGTPQTANADDKQGTAVALAEEREMDDYDFMAGQESASAGYAVMAAGQRPARDGEVAVTGGARIEARAERREQIKAAFKGRLSAEVRQKLMERQAQKAERIKARLEKMKAARAKIGEKVKNAPWVDNGDGTETKSFSFQIQKTVNGQAASRSVEMSRTRNVETKDLVSSSVKFQMTLPSGATRSADRTKSLNADGSYTVVYHSQHTFEDGTKRVADWTKTIALDGTVSGTGTIVWTDKDGNEVKMTQIAHGGTDEAPKAEASGEAVTPEAASEAGVGAEAEAAAEPQPEPAATTGPQAEGSATTGAEASIEAEATAGETQVEATVEGEVAASA